jgi:phage/plasmid-associated DNA primase
MKEDFWMLDPTWHIHVSFNDPPTINGTDDGIRRRLRIIPWQASFRGANKDASLKARLESEELRAGILNWCLAGMRDFRVAGIPEAAAVSVATDEYVAGQDLLRMFIEECCREGHPYHVYFDDFVPAFHVWLESRGENPRVWKQRRVANEFQRRGFLKSRVNEAGPNRGRTLYSGLELTLRPTRA